MKLHTQINLRADVYILFWWAAWHFYCTMSHLKQLLHLKIFYSDTSSVFLPLGWKSIYASYTPISTPLQAALFAVTENKVYGDVFCSWEVSMSVFTAAIYNHCIFCPSLCLFSLLSYINKAEDEKVNYNNCRILTDRNWSDTVLFFCQCAFLFPLGRKLILKFVQWISSSWRKTSFAWTHIQAHTHRQPQMFFHTPQLLPP